MSFLKSNDFADRQRNAQAARSLIAEKFKVASQIPTSPEKIAARAELVRAREARIAERDAGKKVIAAERAEIARKAEAEAAQRRIADEVAALAAQTEEEERGLALLAEQKAARDARYAARKAAKKERRKG